MAVMEKPEPTECGPDDAIVKVEAVGICGSDGGRYHWTNALLKMPHIGGHEYSGTIVRLGANVAARHPHLKVGTRVAGMPIDHCGECPRCTSGLPQHCPKRRVMGAHPTWPGAFAELVVTPAKLLVPIPDALSFIAAATNEPAACSTWAGERCETIAGGSLVGLDGFIAGAGPIGFFALQDVLARGARKVVVTDTDPARLSAIEKAGGIPLDAKGDVLAEVPKLLGDLGSFSIDCVGMGLTRDQCAFLTRPNCPSAWVGLHEDDASTIKAGQHIRRGSVDVGIFAFTPNAFRVAGERLANGTMGFEESDIVVCGFEDGPKWFTRLFDDNSPGKPQKVVFQPNA